ncbi:MAG: hypothetical protein R3C45_14760 [Phycisphaerales bacterium]
MIDLKDLRANPDKYRTGLANKGYPAALLDDLLAADAELRPLITKREQLTAEKNQIGKQMASSPGSSRKPATPSVPLCKQQMQDLKARPDAIKEEESALVAQVAELEAKRDALWLRIPQPADPDVPVGKSADDNATKHLAPRLVRPRRLKKQVAAQDAHRTGRCLGPARLRTRREDGRQPKLRPDRRRHAAAPGRAPFRLIL